MKNVKCVFSFLKTGFMALIRFSKGSVTLTRMRTTESISPHTVSITTVAEAGAKRDPENAFLSPLKRSKRKDAEGCLQHWACVYTGSPPGEMAQLHRSQGPCSHSPQGPSTLVSDNDLLLPLGRWGEVSALNQSFEFIVIHWPFVGPPALLQVRLLTLHYI